MNINGGVVGEREAHGVQRLALRPLPDGPGMKRCVGCAVHGPRTIISPAARLGLGTIVFRTAVPAPHRSARTPQHPK